MKKKSQPNSLDLIRASTYPHTGTQLLERLRGALAEANGFLPSFSYLSRVVGEPKNLIHHWFYAMPQKHLLAFVALLERLPEPKRQAVINGLCRELPGFENPRLAYDPLGVSKLEQLLHQSAGLTWIHGGTEFQRTFLITAMGHGFSRITTGAGAVAGIDVHEPRRWVPIESLTYFRELLPAEKLKKLIRETWSSVTASEPALLLLNGVWSTTPELRTEILAQAENRHVILTTDEPPSSKALPVAAKFPFHVVTVGGQRDGEQRIRFKVETP